MIFKGSFLRVWFLVISVSLLVSACGGGSGGDSSTAGGTTASDTSAGDSAGSTVGDGGGDMGSDTTGGDTNGGADVATALQGAWQSSCKPFNSLDSSEREINVFTGTELIRDWYTYIGTACEGVPIGMTFPQRIYSYEIGSDIATTDGFPAKELNMVIEQLSNVGYLRDAAILGQQRYDIIAFDNETLLRTANEDKDIEDRPTDFSVRTVFTAREPITADTVTAEDFVGTFRTSCEPLSDGANSTITSEISTDTTGYTERVEYYFGTECSGEVAGVIERYYQETFGNTFKTIFGDTMIEVDWSRTAQVIIEGEDVLGGLSLGEARSRFDAYALVNGDTLMRGYCLNNSDDCKKVVSERPDMIDLEFNSDARYKRVQ